MRAGDVDTAVAGRAEKFIDNYFADRRHGNTAGAWIFDACDGRGYCCRYVAVFKGKVGVGVERAVFKHKSVAVA